MGPGARLAGYIGNDSLWHDQSSRRPLCMTASSAALSRRHAHGAPARQPFIAASASSRTRANVPVQTVFIESDSKYFSKGWPLFRKPALPIIFRIRLGSATIRRRRARVFVEDWNATLSASWRPARSRPKRNRHCRDGGGLLGASAPTWPTVHDTSAVGHPPGAHSKLQPGAPGFPDRRRGAAHGTRSG